MVLPNYYLTIPKLLQHYHVITLLKCVNKINKIMYK